MKKVISIVLVALLAFGLMGCTAAWRVNELLDEIDAYENDYTPKGKYERKTTEEKVSSGKSLKQKLEEMDIPEKTLEPLPEPTRKYAQPVDLGTIDEKTLDPYGIVLKDELTGQDELIAFGFEKSVVGFTKELEKSLPGADESMAYVFADAEGIFSSSGYVHELDDDQDAAFFAELYSQVTKLLEDSLGAEYSVIMGENSDWVEDPKTAPVTAELLKEYMASAEGGGYAQYSCIWDLDANSVVSTLSFTTDYMDDGVSAALSIVKTGVGDWDVGTGSIGGTQSDEQETPEAGGYSYDGLTKENPFPRVSVAELKNDPDVAQDGDDGEFSQYTKEIELLGHPGAMFVIAQGDDVTTIGYEVILDTADAGQLFVDMHKNAVKLFGEDGVYAHEEDGNTFSMEDVAAAVENPQGLEIFQVVWTMPDYFCVVELTIESGKSGVRTRYYVD